MDLGAWRVGPPLTLTLALALPLPLPLPLTLALPLALPLPLTLTLPLAPSLSLQGRLLDEQFARLMREYDDDEIGAAARGQGGYA